MAEFYTRTNPMMRKYLVTCVWCIVPFLQICSLYGDEAANSGAIFGTVFEDDGVTIAPGVKVLISKQTSSRGYAGMGIPVVTNERGQYELSAEPGIYMLRIDDLDHRAWDDVHVRVRPQVRQQVDLEAAKLHTWTGLICNSNGQIVPSAAVLISYHVRKSFKVAGHSISSTAQVRGRGVTEPDLPFHSDEAGVCRIPRMLPNSDVDLRIFVLDHGYQEIAIREPADLGSENNRIKLRKLGHIEGVLRFSNGDPISNVTIQAKAYRDDWRVTAKTDSEGRFALAVPPDELGWGIKSDTLGIWFEPTSVAVRENEGVTLKLRAEKATEAEEEPYRVRIHVVDSTGAPVPAGDVLLYPWHSMHFVRKDEPIYFFGPPSRIPVAEDGSVILKSWYEYARVAAVNGNLTSESLDLTLLRTHNDDIHLTTAHPMGAVSGRVIKKSDGRPLMGATVYAMSPSQRQTEQAQIYRREPFSPRGYYPSAEADENGNFRITGLIAGAYELVTCYPDRLGPTGELTATHVELEPGMDSLNCEVIVDDVLMIRGVICRPDGTPLRSTSAFVKISQIDGPKPTDKPGTQHVVCDSAGRFQMRVPALGRYRVTVTPCAWHANYQPVTKDTSITARPPDNPIEFRCSILSDNVALN